MQTFLPYESFEMSANVLDKQRCWKQVVEAAQIIDVLEGHKTGWGNHPAVKMWQGYGTALRNYFNAFLDVCICKHGINTKYTFLDDSGIRYVERPWWLGNEDFHRAMRSRLIEKKPDFYLPLSPNDYCFNDGKYFWPVMETKTFRTI